MNKKQTTVLWVGILIFVLIGLFPPLKSRSPKPISRTNMPQIITVFDSDSKVDVNQLFVYWSIIVVLTGGLIYTLKDKKTRSQKMPKNNK